MTFWLIEALIGLTLILGGSAIVWATNREWDSPKTKGKHRKASSEERNNWPL